MLVGAINYRGNEIIGAYKGSITIGAKKEGILIWHPVEYHFFSCDECKINITPYAQQTAKLSALFQSVLGNSKSEIVANDSIKQGARILNKSNIFSTANSEERVSLSRIREIQDAVCTLKQNQLNTSLSRIRFVETYESFLEKTDFEVSLSRIRWTNININDIINGDYNPDPSAVIRVNPKIVQKYNILLSCSESVIRFIDKIFGAIIDESLVYGPSRILDINQKIKIISDFFFQLNPSRRMVISWKILILNNIILQRRKSSQARIYFNSSVNPKTLLKTRQSAQNYPKVMLWLAIMDNFLASESAEVKAAFDLSFILPILYRTEKSSCLVANLQGKIELSEKYVTGFSNNIDTIKVNKLLTETKFTKNPTAVQKAIYKQQFLISEEYLPIPTSRLINLKKIYVLGEETLYSRFSAQNFALQKISVSATTDTIVAWGSNIFGMESILGTYLFPVIANESLSTFIKNPFMGIEKVKFWNSQKQKVEIPYCIYGEYKKISLYPEEKKTVEINFNLSASSDLQAVVKKGTLLKYAKSINQINENVKFTRSKKWLGKWAKWGVNSLYTHSFSAIRRQRWFINVNNNSFELCNIGITEGLLYIKLNKDMFSYGEGVLSLRELKDSFELVNSVSNSWAFNLLKDISPFDLGEERSQSYVDDKIVVDKIEEFSLVEQLFSATSNLITTNLEESLMSMLNIMHYFKVCQSVDDTNAFIERTILKHDCDILMQLPIYYYLGTFSKEIFTVTKNYFIKGYYSPYFEKAYIYTNSSLVLSQTYKFYLDSNSIINNIESINMNFLTIDQWLWPLTENSIEARPEGNILIRQVYSYSGNGKII